MILAARSGACGDTIVLSLSNAGAAIISAMNLFAWMLAAAIAGQTAAASKVDIVSVTGCLKEAAPNDWRLVNATDPVASTANAPPRTEIPPVPPSGKNEFKLIGVSEFNLPQHKDHAVIVKGLFIKATPVSRLNITSVTTIAASCPAGK
jgi:hypothetical protein